MFWKEFIAALIRYFIAAIAGALVGRGIIGEEIASGLIEHGTGVALGFLILLAPILWRYAKARFDKFHKQNLLEANPAETTFAEQTNKTWKENKYISPV